MTTDNTSRAGLIRLLKDRAKIGTEVTTSGGEKTKVYLDVPGALGDGFALQTAVDALAIHLTSHVHPEQKDSVTAIVGPTTGAIPLVVGLVSSSTWRHWGWKWAIIRDKVKEHGLGRWFVGAEIGPGDKVILTDDVVSTGNSLLEAYARVVYAGAEVLAVVPLMDRSTKARDYFEKMATGLPEGKLGVPYLPVLTYEDLGIEAL